MSSRKRKRVGSEGDDAVRASDGTTSSLKRPERTQAKRQRGCEDAGGTFDHDGLPQHDHDTEQISDQPLANKSNIKNKMEITFGSAGLPQVSTGSPTDDSPQDAILDPTMSLPPPSSSAHASGHLYNTPLPKAVREELVGSTQTSSTFTHKKKPFSLLVAFCRNNDLLLTLVSYFPIPSIISLYSISRTFHFLFNRHHTAFVLSSMRTWAPNADMIYPWRCYKSLCTSDPVLRQKMRYRDLDAEEALWRLGRRGKDLRDVPTLRWLQMVVWRQGICKDMLVQLATKGLRCPPGTLDAVKRMWFILDLPLNSQRVALVHNPSYIGDHVLMGMTMFLLKVDMAFTLPDQAAYPPRYPGTPLNWANNIPTGVPLRKILLAERHLTSLWRVIRGWTWDSSLPRIPMTKLEALRLWVRHKFSVPEDAPAEMKEASVMGVPWHEVGTAGLERTGVAFFNLDGKQVPVTHPAIVSPQVTATHLGKQLLYPHRRVIHLPRVLEKPREPLLRPDELLIREGIKRQLKMHQEWAHMMLWGFSDELGFNWPVFDEKEYSRMDRREVDVMEVIAERERGTGKNAAMQQGE